MNHITSKSFFSDVNFDYKTEAALTQRHFETTKFVTSSTRFFLKLKSQPYCGKKLIKDL